jgi:mannose-6-phosphate isomerase
VARLPSFTLGTGRYGKGDLMDRGEALGPLRFFPVYRRYAFGGRALAEWGKELPPEGAAESWEVSPYPASPSVVREGPAQGLSLREVAQRWPQALLGPLVARGYTQFPFLLKLLDVSGDLPVHVHPTNAQAQSLPGDDPGKEEAWLILKAEPDARVYLGFSQDMDRQEILALAREGRVRERMRAFPVQAGQVVLVPPRTPHAAHGIVFLEIQQVSDRSIFAEPQDVWGRPWPPGGLEEQVERFCQIAHLGPGKAAPAQPLPLTRAGLELVTSVPSFTLWRAHLRNGENLPLPPGPVSVTNLADPVALEAPGHRVFLAHGESAVLPAALTPLPWQVRSPQGSVDLAIGLVAPVEDMLAELARAGHDERKWALLAHPHEAE